MKVAIVYYGIGNLLSVQRALDYCGADVSLATTPEDIKRAERIVVPGVGAFAKCMEHLDAANLREALFEFGNCGRPYLGICVGMQMLMEKSFEFGEHEGLGLFKGTVNRLSVPGQAVPFIGWKPIELDNKRRHYYLVHSYHASPDDRSEILCSYTLGDQRIVAGIRRGNLYGVQFHPEKSAADGIDFLKGFLSE